MVDSFSSTSKLSMFRKSNKEVEPATAAIWLLKFSLSVGGMPGACPPRTIAGTKPVLSSFLTPVFIQLLSMTRFLLAMTNLTTHVFIISFSLAPNFTVPGLRSTPSVSALSAGRTPSFSLCSL